MFSGNRSRLCPCPLDIAWKRVQQNDESSLKRLPWPQHNRLLSERRTKRTATSRAAQFQRSSSVTAAALCEECSRPRVVTRSS